MAEAAQIAAERPFFDQERRARRAPPNVLQPALARRGVHQTVSRDLNDDRFKIAAAHNSSNTTSSIDPSGALLPRYPSSAPRSRCFSNARASSVGMPTISQACEDGKADDVPDCDIEFALSSIWDARANAFAPAGG